MAFWYVDISGQVLVRMDPASGEEKLWEVGQAIGFDLPCQSGRWIWGGKHGIYFLNLESGESTAIVDPEADLPNNRFNDAAISPDGRLFAGTIGGDKTTGAATLFRLDPDLSCHTAFSNVTTGISGKGPEEHAGKIFVVRNAGKGMPQREFRDV